MKLSILPLLATLLLSSVAAAETVITIDVTLDKPGWGLDWDVTVTVDSDGTVDIDKPGFDDSFTLPEWAIADCMPPVELDLGTFEGTEDELKAHLTAQIAAQLILGWLACPDEEEEEEKSARFVGWLEGLVDDAESYLDSVAVDETPSVMATAAMRQVVASNLDGEWAVATLLSVVD